MVTPAEFRGDLWLQKTGDPGLSCGIFCVILRLAVLVELRLVTDGQTDTIASRGNKKLSYRRGTALCVVSVEILPIATQQCSTTSPEQIEVMKSEG